MTDERYIVIKKGRIVIVKVHSGEYFLYDVLPSQIQPSMLITTLSLLETESKCKCKCTCNAVITESVGYM